MRCRFAASEHSVEREALEQFDARVHHFYELLKQPREPGELSAALLQVDRGFELLSVHGAFPTVELQVRSEPRKRPRLARFASACPVWASVTCERGRRDFPGLCAEVRERSGYDLSQARVRAGVTRGHLLQLVVYLHGAGGALDARADHAAELAVEGCLGERTVDDWIGSIDVAPLPRGGPLTLVQQGDALARAFGLSELALAVDGAVRGIYAELPSEPFCCREELSDWVLLEAEPSPETQKGQGDLMVTSTCAPEMLKCFLQGGPFSSLRFSRHGERFAYLKYRAGGNLKTRVEQRQRLEDALDRALRLERSGCVIGNGFGGNHCYVDLALLELDAALDTSRRVARQVELPRASWVLFCDSEWELEWVGVWPDTPAP